MLFQFNDLLFLPSRRRLKVDKFDYVAVCSDIAKITDGLSGREISKLGVAWQVSDFLLLHRNQLI